MLLSTLDLYRNTNLDNVTKNLFTILHVLGKEVSEERIATLQGPAAERLGRIRSQKPVIAAGTVTPARQTLRCLH